jgi:hypothetical protein
MIVKKLTQQVQTILPIASLTGQEAVFEPI